MSQRSQPCPSIFNDVIGPVMRGPSSSHCAAAVRIGRMVRDLMDGAIEQVRIQYDPDGSLATTHTSQGSDMGLFGGLLGWDVADDRLTGAAEAIQAAGIRVDIEIAPMAAPHPNTYKIEASNSKEAHTVIALSTGGGIIAISEIDGIPITMAGDYFETLIFCRGAGAQLREYLHSHRAADAVHLLASDGRELVEVKSQAFLGRGTIEHLQSHFPVQTIKQIAPVLPILSRPGIEIPFITCAELLVYNRDRQEDLGTLACQYESARGGISPSQVKQTMAGVIRVMRSAIQEGLAGTQYADRILGSQSPNFQKQMDAGLLLDGGMLNRMILYTTALMESKSAMGVIVAAPTAGSCGGLPGACIGAADEINTGEKKLVRAMLAGGLIGVFIAARSTFAAEVGGCQVECGAGSGMAAAALVDLAGGTAQQAVNAAALALQNILGMICDPVANRVEVPCLGKNVMAASNALACANMALADYDPVIPLDEVIATLDQVGGMLPAELRCTALGGLSTTPTSRKIENDLATNNGADS